MKLSVNSHKPLYMQIVDVVNANIREGRLKTGDKLPSEANFAEKYSVSRVTVRRALDELKNSGVIVTYQGKGCFVNKPMLERPLRQTSELLSFTQMCKASGKKPGEKLVKIDYVPGSDHENAFLHQPSGSSLLRIVRIRTADGIPVFLEHSLFPNKGFDFLKGDTLKKNSMSTALVEGLGRGATNYASCTIRTCQASADLASLLSIPIGEALFFESKYLIDSQERSMFIAKDYMVGSYFVFDL